MEIGLHDVALDGTGSGWRPMIPSNCMCAGLPLVEPLFAIIKNRLDAQQFKLRGIANVGPNGLYS